MIYSVVFILYREFINQIWDDEMIYSVASILYREYILKTLPGVVFNWENMTPIE